MNEYIILAFIILIVTSIYIGMRCVIEIRQMKADVDHIYSNIANITKVMAEHQEAIQLLGENGEEPEEVEDKTEEAQIQKSLDDRYNEGMDNIFGYSVNTGINLNRGN